MPSKEACGHGQERGERSCERPRCSSARGDRDTSENQQACRRAWRECYTVTQAPGRLETRVRVQQQEEESVLA